MKNKLIHGFSAVKAAAITASLSAVLLCLVFLSGSTPKDTVKGTALFDVKDGCDTRLLREIDGKAVYIHRDGLSAYVSVIRCSDGLLLSRDILPFIPAKALHRGDKLFLLSPESGDVEIYGSSLSFPVSRIELNCDPADVSLFECDGTTVYHTLSDHPKKLIMTSASGSSETIFPEDISFIGFDGVSIYVSAGSSLYRLENGGYHLVTSSLTVPIRGVFENGYFIDGSGVLLKLTESGLDPLFNSGCALYPFSFCFSREKCLILSNDPGEIMCFGEDGTLKSVCSPDGTPLAVCPSGCIYRKDDTVYFAVSNFTEAQPTPLPSPTPGEDDPPLRTEGDFIIVDEGFTAAELRELFKPDVVEIRTPGGELIINGKLSTGMTAGRYTVVVKGDCNCTGTVNTADISSALSSSLGSAFSDSASFAAADINGDGVVDGRDLLLLTKII